MALVVQKYGGSSVSDIEPMRRVARRVVATRACAAPPPASADAGEAPGAATYYPDPLALSPRALPFPMSLSLALPLTCLSTPP